MQCIWYNFATLKGRDLEQSETHSPVLHEGFSSSVCSENEGLSPCLVWGTAENVKFRTDCRKQGRHPPKLVVCSIVRGHQASNKKCAPLSLFQLTRSQNSPPQAIQSLSPSRQLDFCDVSLLKAKAPLKGSKQPAIHPRSIYSSDLTQKSC